MLATELFLLFLPMLLIGYLVNQIRLRGVWRLWDGGLIPFGKGGGLFSRVPRRGGLVCGHDTGLGAESGVMITASLVVEVSSPRPAKSFLLL